MGDSVRVYDYPPRDTPRSAYIMTPEENERSIAIAVALHEASNVFAPHVRNVASTPPERKLRMRKS